MGEWERGKLLEYVLGGRKENRLEREDQMG